MNIKQINNYKNATNSVKLSGDFNRKTIAHLHNEAVKIKREAPAKRNRIIRYYAAAAAALIVLTGSIGYDINRRNIDLPNSDGVSARYIYFSKQSIKSDYQLIYKDESEIIAECDLVASGKVTAIRNITVSFGDGFSEAWSVVTLKIDKNLKGDLAAGKEITIRVGTPLEINGIWVEDNDVVEKLKVGNDAIFFLKQYSSDDLFVENGNTLFLADISEYGLSNGVQYAIVNTNDGLVFSNVTYNIPTGTTYEEAVDYIAGLIG